MLSFEKKAALRATMAQALIEQGLIEKMFPALKGMIQWATVQVCGNPKEGYCVVAQRAQSHVLPAVELSAAFYQPFLDAAA